MNVQSSGIHWNITTRLNDVDFADDICLLMHAVRDMETKWNRLIYYGKQDDSFKYLGSIIAKDDGADADVQSRIQKVRQSLKR